MSKEKRFVLCSVGTLGMFMGSVAHATTPVLSLNKTTLLANTTGQTIQLLVNGTDTNVHADDVSVQVGDGGSANEGVSTGPLITGLDLSTNTIFSGQGGSFTGSDGALIAFGDVAPSLSFLASDNNAGNPILLATITLSTVGFNGSSFQLSFQNVDGTLPTDLLLLNGSTLDTVVPTGPGIAGASTITITVPEPAPISLGILCLGGVLLRRRSRDTAYALDV